MSLVPSPGGLTPPATDRMARLVDRAAAAIGPRDTSRRGFLAKTAVVGSALMVGPLQFILRPGTAYAAVCGDSATCATGWTAFCCTINNGANTCPPGSYPGGWWKADGSAFCGGGPRYYVDCNRLPGSSSCSCHCPSPNPYPAGSCDQRRVCCNVFRYGQCHLEVVGVTEVVCRVILCTAPWVWDPACGTTSLTDDRTASHSAPCLPGAGASPVAIKYQDLGMTGSMLGFPISGEGDAAGGGRLNFYQFGAIFWRSDLGAHEVHGAIYGRWSQLNRELGRLGYPKTDERPAAGGRGAQSCFERGCIYWSPTTGARAVYGAILAYYFGVGEAGGHFCCPTSDEGSTGTQGGAYNFFEQGMIIFRPDLGAHGVRSAFFGLWSQYGREWSHLGYPVTDEFAAGDGRGTTQLFEGGRMWWSAATGAQDVHGPALTRYLQLGGPVGVLGYPTAKQVVTVDGLALSQNFERGALVTHPTYGVVVVRNAFFALWAALGRQQGVLGYPTADEVAVGDGLGATQIFQGGRTWWSAATGARAVHGPLLQKYLDVGGPPSSYGYPTSSVGTTGAGQYVFTQNGMLIWRADLGPSGVRSGFFEVWSRYGREWGFLNYPLGDEAPVGDGRGVTQSFVGGRMWWTTATGSHEVHGPVLAQYLDQGGPTGALGYPTSDVYASGSALRCDFERGSIVI